MAEPAGTNAQRPPGTRGRPRPTLGLLLDRPDEGYQNAVLQGVRVAAARQDVNLLCFAGGQLGASSGRNALFELVSARSVDALLLMTGPLYNHIGREKFLAWCARFAPLPMVSLAEELPGIPSLCVDGAAGVREAITHLVQVHGRRRIAFIEGPPANSEAAERLAAYRQVLPELSLPLDPALMVSGDFLRSSGAAAVARLFDGDGPTPDAVLAADDNMAIGALEALTERGLRCPEDVAVLGFDDVEEARFVSPALSTVAQPLQELGRAALGLLMDQLRGEAVPLLRRLPARLCVRHSCGCDQHGRLPTVARSGSGSPAEAERAWQRATGELIPDPVAVGLPEDWAVHFHSSFLAQLGGAPGAPFLTTLGSLLEGGMELQERYRPWQEVVSCHRLIFLAGQSAGEAPGRAEGLWHEARMLVAGSSEAQQARKRLLVERWSTTLSDTSGALLASFDASALVRALSLHLPQLGIDSCFVSLYEPEGLHSRHARLLHAHDLHRAEPAREEQAVFLSQQLVPTGRWPRERRHAYMVQPLYLEGRQIGFALFELAPQEGFPYESLREAISAALEGSTLMRQVIQQDVARRQLLRYIVDITPDLHRTQPPGDLLARVLQYLSRLFEVSDALIALRPEGDEEAPLRIQAGTGTFSAAGSLEALLAPEDREAVARCVEERTTESTDRLLLVPLKVSESAPGVLMLSGVKREEVDQELLQIFSNQVAAAIHSSRLHEMAALDPLTGVHARRFFERWMLSELRGTMRSGRPLSLLMLDLDDMKSINDNGGHLLGDEALIALGSVLREATRDNDLVGRYGGDEFIVLLPRTGVEGAVQVANRILELLAPVRLQSRGGPLGLSVSIGVSSLLASEDEGGSEALPLDYFKRQSQLLIEHADQGVYASKKNSGSHCSRGPLTEWQPPLETQAEC